MFFCPNNSRPSAVRVAVATAALASLVLVSTSPHTASASGASPTGVNVGFDFQWTNGPTDPDAIAGHATTFLENDGVTLNTCSRATTATDKGCQFIFEYTIGGTTQPAATRKGNFVTWSNPTEYETVEGTTSPKNGGCQKDSNGQRVNQQIPLTLNDCFNANSFGQIFFPKTSGALSSFKMSMTCLQPTGQKIELYALLYELTNPATAIKGTSPIASTKVDLSTCPTATSWQGKTFSASDFAMIPFNFKDVTLTQGTPYGVFFAGSAVPGAAPTGGADAVANSSGTTEDELQEELPEELKLLTAVRLIEKGDKTKTLTSRTPDTCITADGRVIALSEGECKVQIRSVPKVSVSAQSSSGKVLSTFTTTIKTDGAQAGLTAAKATTIRFKKYSALPNRIPASLVKEARSAEGIVILGHTGTVTGNSPGNVKLSLARATYVRNHLVNQKVKSSVIYVQGVAARQPVTTKKTEKDQRANRRVEVYLLT
jgi:hypothetical protein